MVNELLKSDKQNKSYDTLKRAVCPHYCVSTRYIGGRDREGCPLVTVTQPKSLQVDWLMNVGVNEIIDMLAYFTSVPK